MRIDGNGRVLANAPRNGRPAASTGAVFSPASEAGPQRAAPAAAPASSSGIEALLALQGVEDSTMGRRKAVRRAGALLDALEEIRADLLVGRVGEGRLNRAVALLQQARERSGPDLEALIADIELRVRVELAKLGRFPSL